MIGSLGVTALMLLLVPFPARAAEAGSTGEKSEPGLVLTFAPVNGASAEHSLVDARVARVASLYVPRAQSPTPFLQPGPFRAVFEGDISMRLRDFLVFSAIGRGKLTVTINAKTALDLSGDFAGKPGERTRLGKGKNHVVVTYESPPDGDAEFRLLWAARNVVPEPISPGLLTHDPTDALNHSLMVRQGRFLFVELRCAKCHAPETSGLSAEVGMPELRIDAPSFDDIGSRLSRDWIAAWIDNPRKMRAQSHMPRLFGDDAASRQKVSDAAAYLSSLAGKDGKEPAPSEGDVAAGGRLFAHLNCVACHTLPNQPPDAGRVSLTFAKAKYLPGGLQAYLRKPHAHYAWNPMPDFRLSDTEASGLSAFLESFEWVKVPVPTAGDAVRGAGIVRSAGCLSCHGSKELKAEATTVPMLSSFSQVSWARGCMAVEKEKRGIAPDFELTDDQRAALQAFFEAPAGSLERDAPAEFAERQVVSLRCTACHARDGAPSLLSSTLEPQLLELQRQYPPGDPPAGETFAPDQRAPLLTWAGEKLRPQWMAKFIAGQIPDKPRPYLRARMPGFDRMASGIAVGLASEHGCAPTAPQYGQPDQSLAEVGRGLVGRTPNKSFGCVQCHPVGPQPAFQPFEAPAINLNIVTERLRKDYYLRWIHDPLRVDPEAKMPRFDDADGKTGIADVFGGDARQQFEAIWQFLLEGKRMKGTE